MIWIAFLIWAALALAWISGFLVGRAFERGRGIPKAGKVSMTMNVSAAGDVKRDLPRAMEEIMPTVGRTGKR